MSGPTDWILHCMKTYFFDMISMYMYGDGEDKYKDNVEDEENEDIDEHG